MRRAVLFLILTFAVYAVAQKGGAASGSAAGAASAGSMGGAAGAPAASTSPNVSPGLNGQPATGPAATAPTTDLGPSTTQPLGTGQVTAGSAGISNLNNTGGFITNGAYGYGGYVPMLQTPEASFPNGVTNIPNNPAGISNMPLSMQYAAAAASAAAPSSGSNGGVFNTGAASFGLSSQPPETRSLGEIARDFRAREATQHASRVYTNDDIARLNQNNGQVPLGSNLGPQSSNAQNNANQGPQSPTTPAVSNNRSQPPQNRNLPGREAQPPQPR